MTKLMQYSKAVAIATGYGVMVVIHFICTQLLCIVIYTPVARKRILSRRLHSNKTIGELEKTVITIWSASKLFKEARGSPIWRWDRIPPP
jgi:hypothetical protein